MPGLSILAWAVAVKTGWMALSTPSCSHDLMLSMHLAGVSTELPMMSWKIDASRRCFQLGIARGHINSQHTLSHLRH